MRVERYSDEATILVVTTQYDKADGTLERAQTNVYGWEPTWSDQPDIMFIRETSQHFAGRVYSVVQAQHGTRESTRSNVIEMTGPALIPVPEVRRDVGLSITFAIICLLIAAVAPRILK